VKLPDGDRLHVHIVTHVPHQGIDAPPQAWGRSLPTEQA
jgi:hypothetical protein